MRHATKRPEATPRLIPISIPTFLLIRSAVFMPWPNGPLTACASGPGFLLALFLSYPGNSEAMISIARTIDVAITLHALFVRLKVDLMMT